MNSLVFLEPNKIDAEPFTTSDIIAKYTGINYRSVQRTIETHEKRLAKFGRVRFEITPLQTKGGIQNKKIYQLNEPQATLLITFLKNTEIVADFKTELVRQFYAMRAELNKRQILKIERKPVRRTLTDIIKEVEPDNKWAYKLYTDLAYKAVTGKIARRLREERSAPKKAIASDYMSSEEIAAVTKADTQGRISSTPIPFWSASGCGLRGVIYHWFSLLAVRNIVSITNRRTSSCFM